VAERKSFPLRIDPALWAEIERLAHAELRSVNAQIEYLLRDALARRRKGRGEVEPDGRSPPADATRERER
jgi:hypothetical protein